MRGAVSLFETRNIPFPIEYQWAWDCYQKQIELTWVPTQQPMTDDVRDWKRGIADGERTVIKSIYKIFTRMDQMVHNFYESGLPEIKANEVRMMLSQFRSMECTHMWAYIYLIQSVGIPETWASSYQDNCAMLAKCEALEKYKDASLPLRIACFNLFGEGVILYGSFAILASFQLIGLMQGTATLVKWSQRDEELHVFAAAQLFKAVLAETGEKLEGELEINIINCCQDIVETEQAFIDSIFGDNVVRSITKEEVKKYVEYVADLRLALIGLEPIYKHKENPLSRLDPYLHGMELTNFFEWKPTDYSHKSVGDGDWSTAFDYGSAPCAGCD